MTTAAAAEIKVEWGRAWHALRGLIADPERTDLVFEILEALTGPDFDREFERLRSLPEGQRLLAERPKLLDVLSDRATLREMPEGSLGRAYARFMDAENLTADGLVAAEKMVERKKRQNLDPDRQYFSDRLRDMHDLWHVLTGYGRDEAGEAANLAFSAGQVPSRGILLIVGAAAFLGPWTPTLKWQRYLYRAWKRGRSASRLGVAPYEELLSLPLESVRNRLGISPAAVVHPEGIVVATRDNPAMAMS